jgi:hypothetical protein
MDQARKVANLIAMNGLYALKPWYGERLAGLRKALVSRHVSPNALTATGVVFGCAAGATIYLLKPGAIAGVCVAILLACSPRLRQFGRFRSTAVRTRHPIWSRHK